MSGTCYSTSCMRWTHGQKCFYNIKRHRWLTWANDTTATMWPPIVHVSEQLDVLSVSPVYIMVISITIIMQIRALAGFLQCSYDDELWASASRELPIIHVWPWFFASDTDNGILTGSRLTFAPDSSTTYTYTELQQWQCHGIKMQGWGKSSNFPTDSWKFLREKIWIFKISVLPPNFVFLYRSSMQLPNCHGTKCKQWLQMLTRNLS